MKSELTSIDLKALVSEWQEIVGGRFSKAYMTDDKKPEIYLQFSKEGKRLMRIILPGIAYLTSTRPEFPKNPPGFIMFLRKKLNNGRVTGIKQRGFDRIFIIKIEKKVEDEIKEYELVVELISPGNVILLGDKVIKKGEAPVKGIILNLLKPQKFKDRVLRGGIRYEPPPEALNLEEASDEKLKESAKESEMDSIVKSLAIGWGLGGHYAELICQRAGIDKNKKEYDKEDLKKSIKELRALLKENPKPQIINKDYVMAFGGEVESSFNKALDDLLTREEIIIEKPSKKKEKWKTILESQEHQRKGFEKAAKLNQRKGEIIYEHYQEIKEAIISIKNEGRPPNKKWIKDYDAKKRTLTVEFGD